jgi:hypothetical protein
MSKGIQHGSEGEPVEHFLAPRDPAKLRDADPFHPLGFGRVGWFADACRAVSEEAMKYLIAQPVRRLIAHERAQRSRLPSRLLDGLAACRLYGCLARVYATGRDLPTPCVGNEAMPPQQQHAPIAIVHYRSRGLVRHPYDVMLESWAARNFDVAQRQSDPFAFVDCPLAVHLPSHPATVGDNANACEGGFCRTGMSWA